MLADVTFLYKALHGIIYIDDNPYVDFYKETDHYSFGHNDKSTLKLRYARMNVVKYTFFHIELWEHGTFHS